MPHHFPEWVWYVAQLVVEARVDGIGESTLLIESILYRADSPEAAFLKAESWCASSDHGYRNKFGKAVSQRYLGIHDIDDLQAEQLDDEQVLQVRVVSSPSRHVEARDLVRSRSELSIFGGQRSEFLHLNQ